MGNNVVLSGGRYAALSVGGAAVTLWIGAEWETGIRQTELQLRPNYCVDGAEIIVWSGFKDEG